MVATLQIKMEFVTSSICSSIRLSIADDLGRVDSGANVPENTSGAIRLKGVRAAVAAAELVTAAR